MILHYLKIAWRNLLKYRMQTAVNVVGIAVGFACFAFANLWMRYEASFDSRYDGNWAWRDNLRWNFPAYSWTLAS